jgi:predicted naringenin-chalcone synthase
MIHLSGCNGGLASLRLAKDLAENNRGARILVACVELTLIAFRGPEEASPHRLISQAIFGDGAAAVIVGADAVRPVKHPLFVIVSAPQTVVPGTDHVLTMQLREAGLDGNIFTKELVPLAADNVVQCLGDAFGQLGVAVEWNDLFWAVHPGMREILEHIESALQLEPGKLSASRSVLRQYGNMLGATVIFVLDEVRRRIDEDDNTDQWGVMMGFGPGFTIETMVLHAVRDTKID